MKRSGRPEASDLPAEGVYRRLWDDGHRFQFSQIMRLLELAFPDHPMPGTTPDFRDPPIQLRPSVDMTFPPTDVKRVDRPDPAEDVVEVVVSFLGLYGVDSPLPYYFYERLAQNPSGPTPHRDFLDLFNHRLYAFFYRAWKKYRPPLYYQDGGRDIHSQRFVSLAGLGTSDACSDVPIPRMRLAALAGTLGSQTRNATGLAALIEAIFDEVEAEVLENVPRWVDIPCRSQLGDPEFELGVNATVGQQVYDRSGKFRIRLGPLEHDQYASFLPGGEAASTLHTLVRLYAPDHLDYDVELRIPSDDLPQTQLGNDGSQLGFTTSLGVPTAPVTRRVVDYTSADADLGERT